MSLSSRRVCGSLLVVLALISFNDCGGSKSPSGTTPVTQPSVNPGPTPTPVATADPPVPKSCQQTGWGTLNVKCPMETGGFQKHVNGAILTLPREHRAS